MANLSGTHVEPLKWTVAMIQVMLANCYNLCASDPHGGSYMAMVLSGPTKTYFFRGVGKS